MQLKDFKPDPITLLIDSIEYDTFLNNEKFLIIRLREPINIVKGTIDNREVRDVKEVRAMYNLIENTTYELELVDNNLVIYQPFRLDVDINGTVWLTKTSFSILYHKSRFDRRA